jgi:pimeloyl-ACP methyl ester carboxylesterase
MVRPVALVTILALGCATPPRKLCPDCVVLDRGHTALPRLKPGAERLFILVPGLLGYGWEWNDPVRRLRATPTADFVVFFWDPWASVERAAGELRAVVANALAEAPPSVREVVIVAHSGGGLVAARAVGGLAPPSRKVTVVTIGAPFAGMHICPCSEDDLIHAPFMLGISTSFSKYPPPPPGVEIIEYITSYPADPVMQPHWGKVPAPADVGPVADKRIYVDPRFDHNHIVDKVMSDLLSR